MSDNNPMHTSNESKGFVLLPLTVLRRVWSASEGLANRDRSVLTALALRAGKDGRCWPSLDRIAADSGVARSTAAKAINELIHLGWLKRIPRPRPKTTLYIVREPDSPAAGRPWSRTPIVRESDADGPVIEHELPSELPRELITPTGGAAMSPERKRSQNRKERKNAGEATRRPSWLAPYADAWTEIMGGPPAYGKLARALHPLHDQHGLEAVLAVWRHYLAAHARYASPHGFCAKFGVWADEAGTALSNAEREFIAPDSPWRRGIA